MVFTMFITWNMLKKLTKKKHCMVRDMTTKHTVTFLNSKKIHLKPPPPLSQILYNGITLFLFTITKKKI